MEVIIPIEQKVDLTAMITSKVNPIPDWVEHPDLGYEYEDYKRGHASIEAYALEHEPKDHWVVDKVFCPLIVSKLVHPSEAIPSVAKQEWLHIQDDHQEDHCLRDKDALRNHHAPSQEEVLEQEVQKGTHQVHPSQVDEHLLLLRQLRKRSHEKVLATAKFYQWGEEKPNVNSWVTCYHDKRNE